MEIRFKIATCSKMNGPLLLLANISYLFAGEWEAIRSEPAGKNIHQNVQKLTKPVKELNEIRMRNITDQLNFNKNLEPRKHVQNVQNLTAEVNSLKREIE